MKLLLTPGFSFSGCQLVKVSQTHFNSQSLFTWCACREAEYVRVHSGYIRRQQFLHVWHIFKSFKTETYTQGCLTLYRCVQWFPFSLHGNVTREKRARGRGGERVELKAKILAGSLISVRSKTNLGASRPATMPLPSHHADCVASFQCLWRLNWNVSPSTGRISNAQLWNKLTNVESALKTTVYISRLCPRRTLGPLLFQLAKTIQTKNTFWLLRLQTSTIQLPSIVLHIYTNRPPTGALSIWWLGHQWRHIQSTSH